MSHNGLKTVRIMARRRKLTFRVLWRNPSIATQAPRGPHANSKNKRKSSEIRRQYGRVRDRRCPRIPPLSLVTPANHQARNLSNPYTIATMRFQPNNSLQAKREIMLTLMRRLCQESMRRILSECLVGRTQRIFGITALRRSTKQLSTTKLEWLHKHLFPGQAVIWERYQSETTASNPSIEIVERGEW